MARGSRPDTGDPFEPFTGMESDSLLIDRLKSSAVLIGVLSALIYLDATGSWGPPGFWLLPALAFFTLGTAWDFCTIMVSAGRSVPRVWTVAMAGMIAFSAAVPMLWPLVGSNYPEGCPVGKLGWILMFTVAAVFLTVMESMRRFDTGGSELIGSELIERTFASVFVSVYVGLPMALIIGLRSMGTGTWGLAAVLTMLAVTKSADAGAYFVGRQFGKRKLIPRLSPGKTWAGAWGGIVTATIVAFASLQWLFPWLAPDGGQPFQRPSIEILANPVGGALLLGPLLALTGMVGDLAESFVKRSFDTKDSGHWLPGLGGVWDVTDSPIATIMPAYLCFAAGVGSNI